MCLCTFVLSFRVVFLCPRNVLNVRMVFMYICKHVEFESCFYRPVDSCFKFQSSFYVPVNNCDGLHISLHVHVNGCVEYQTSVCVSVNSTLFQTPLTKRLKAYDSDSEKGSDGGAPKKIPRVSSRASDNKQANK